MKFPSVHWNFIIQLHGNSLSWQESADRNNNARENFFKKQTNMDWTWNNKEKFLNRLSISSRSSRAGKIYPLTRHHTFEIDCMQEKLSYSLAVFLLFNDVEDPYHVIGL